jgi:hypothetical protein
VTSVTFYGHVTMTYPDYIDTSTGKTLVCQPGQTYNVVPASGHPVAAGTTMPQDGRFASNMGMSFVIEKEEPEEIPEEVPVSSVTTDIHDERDV